MLRITLRVRLLSTLLLVAALSQFALAADKPQTLTGVVTDEMCGATHMMPGKTDPDCTRACVREGSKYALVVDKKVYTLEGHTAELEELAGDKVTVTGTVKGETVQVSSVTAAK